MLWNKPVLRSAPPLSDCCRPLLGPLAALLAFGALAGCSSPGEQAPDQPARCPAATVLEGAARTSAHLPGEPARPETLRYVAAINDLETLCRHGADGLRMELRFPVVVEAGPAFEGGPIELALFVATVGPEGTVLGKEALDVTLSPARGGGPVGEVQNLTLALPASSEAQARASRLFVGFQVPRPAPVARPEELLR